MFSQRRQKLNLKNGECALIVGQSFFENPRGICNSNLFYLTGLKNGNAALFLKKTKNFLEEYLFVDLQKPKRVVWEGKAPTKSEIAENTQVNNVYHIRRVYDLLYRHLRECKKLFLEESRNPYVTLIGKTVNIKSFALSANPKLKFAKILPRIASLRMVKSKAEVQKICKAIQITKKGIDAVLKEAKAGMMEYELEAVFDYETKRCGAFEKPFLPIIASGENSCTLHYTKNNRKINNGDVVLLDVGCKVDGYCSDISRCFFVGGSSDKVKEKEKLYEALKKIQKKVIAKVKPGILIKKLNVYTRELIAFELKKLKMIKSKKEVKDYFFHSVSHHLGLDAHDLSIRNKPLQVGNVITIEPGIYLREIKSGFRIEDDILVTETGSVNLSKAISYDI